MSGAFTSLGLGRSRNCCSPFFWARLRRRPWHGALMVSGPCQLAHRSHLRHLHKRLRSHPLRHPPPQHVRAYCSPGETSPPRARMHPTKRRPALPPHRPRALACWPTRYGPTTPSSGHRNCHCRTPLTHAIRAALAGCGRRHVGPARAATMA